MAEQNILNVKNLPSGRDGQFLIKYRGEIRDANFIQQATANVTKEKEGIKVIGSNETQHKANGFELSIDVTYLVADSIFNEMMEEYAVTGSDPYFDIIMINEDKSGKLGKQTIQYIDCNLDEVALSILDVDETFPKADITLTARTFKVIEKFNKIKL